MSSMRNIALPRDDMLSRLTHNIFALILLSASLLVLSVEAWCSISPGLQRNFAQWEGLSVLRQTKLQNGSKEGLPSFKTHPTRSRTHTLFATKLATEQFTKIQQTPSGGLKVSSDIELPFSAEVAYDTFSDLPRQPEWSPWLHSVEWMEDNMEESKTSSKWTLRVMGIKYGWTSVATYQKRPHTIEWESTSGLKNYGRVHIQPRENGGSHMAMSMNFAPPRLIAGFFRNTKALQRFMEKKMIRSSLEMFREVVIESAIPIQNVTILFPI